MATNTTNYKLKKPATTDYVTIGDINDNMDKIDAQMKANANAIAGKAGTSVATQSANGLMSSADKTKLDTAVWMILPDLGSNYTMNVSDFNQAYPCRRKVNTFASNALSPDGANAGDYYLYSLGHTDAKGYSTILAVTPRLNGSNGGTNLYIGHFWNGTWTGWTLVNAVSGVKGNSESTYRTGNVNITKANIGLGNVDNTSDVNKPISTAVQNALNGKQATMSAGTGISLDGATINHSNSVTAQTSYVGSATAVPRIQYDAQGHITACTTATIYPPTSAGTSGQIWQSDGNGTGVWQTLDTAPTANSTKAVTSGGVYNAISRIPNYTVLWSGSITDTSKTINLSEDVGLFDIVYLELKQGTAYIAYAPIPYGLLGTTYVGGRNLTQADNSRGAFVKLKSSTNGTVLMGYAFGVTLSRVIGVKWRG